MTEDETKIRERAHRLWEEAGCPEGRDQEFWEQAKAEIEGEGDGGERRAPKR